MSDDRRRGLSEEDENELRKHVSMASTSLASTGQAQLLATVVRKIAELTRAIADAERAGSALSERIRKLNVWLLWITIVVAVLTGVQILVALLNFIRR